MVLGKKKGREGDELILVDLTGTGAQVNPIFMWMGCDSFFLYDVWGRVGLVFSHGGAGEFLFGFGFMRVWYGGM